MKKYLKSGLTILFFSIVTILMVQIYATIIKKNKIANSIQIMEEFEFVDLNNQIFDNNFLTQKFTIFIFFNSDCEHCEKEITELNANINQFKDVTFLLISNEALLTLKRFANKFKINSQPIKFLHCDQKYYNDIFGISVTPTILIYKGKKLVTIFKGETKISEISKVISSNK